MYICVFIFIYPLLISLYNIAVLIIICRFLIKVVAIICKSKYNIHINKIKIKQIKYPSECQIFNLFRCVIRTAILYNEINSGQFMKNTTIHIHNK